MFFDLFSVIFGLLKILFYKLFCFRRIRFSGIPKMNRSFSVGIKPGSKLVLGKGFRSRNNVSFRVYNKGLVQTGENCFMNDNCSLNARKKITLGNHVIFGQNVNVFDHDHDFRSSDMEEFFVEDEVVIGDNVWVGANSVILKGSRIGDNCVIAAGTIVKGEIPAGSLVYDKRDRQIVEIRK